MFLNVLSIGCLSLIKLVTTDKMSGYIVGGYPSKIESFPHSVFLHMKSHNTGVICGGSILTQHILLTAAHCLRTCKNTTFSIDAYTGHMQKYTGSKSQVSNSKIHENYDEISFANDIALLILERDLKFNQGVKRVAILRSPPKYDVAYIAGWGWVNDYGTKSNVLKQTSQTLFSRETCMKELYKIPVGTLCGSNPNKSHPQKGDSGCALVVHKFIQIGISSFYRQKYSNTTLIYTDVSYFYDWIQKTLETCLSSERNKTNIVCRKKKHC